MSDTNFYKCVASTSRGSYSMFHIIYGGNLCVCSQQLFCLFATTFLSVRNNFFVCSQQLLCLFSTTTQNQTILQHKNNTKPKNTTTTTTRTTKQHYKTKQHNNHLPVYRVARCVMEFSLTYRVSACGVGRLKVGEVLQRLCGRLSNKCPFTAHATCGAPTKNFKVCVCVCVCMYV